MVEIISSRDASYDEVIGRCTNSSFFQVSTLAVCFITIFILSYFFNFFTGEKYMVMLKKDSVSSKMCFGYYPSCQEMT